MARKSEISTCPTTCGNYNVVVRFEGGKLSYTYVEYNIHTDSLKTLCTILPSQQVMESKIRCKQTHHHPTDIDVIHTCAHPTFSRRGISIATGSG